MSFGKLALAEMVERPSKGKCLKESSGSFIELLLPKKNNAEVVHRVRITVDEGGPVKIYNCVALAAPDQRRCPEVPVGVSEDMLFIIGSGKKQIPRPRWGRGMTIPKND